METLERRQHRAPETCDRLADWATQPVAALMEAFGSAATVTDLGPLAGHPRCRGLGLDGRLAGRDRFLRSQAAKPAFLWNGKSFRLDSPTSGWGYNRLTGAGLVAALPFAVTVAPSVWDGRGAVRIDYGAHPRCPRWHRGFLDELREVEPGLFLGPAGRRTADGMRPLAWFAVDTHEEVTGVAI